MQEWNTAQMSNNRRMDKPCYSQTMKYYSAREKQTTDTHMHKMNESQDHYAN